MWDVGGAVEGEGRYQEGWGGGGCQPQQVW